MGPSEPKSIHSTFRLSCENERYVSVILHSQDNTNVKQIEL